MGNIQSVILGSDLFGYVKTLDWVLTSPWVGIRSVNNWYPIEYQLLPEALNGVPSPYVFLSLLMLFPKPKSSITFVLWSLNLRSFAVSRVPQSKPKP